MTMVISTPPVVWHRTLPKPAGMLANLPPGQPLSRHVLISHDPVETANVVSQHSSPKDVLRSLPDRVIPDHVSEHPHESTQFQNAVGPDDDVDMLESDCRSSQGMVGQPSPAASSSNSNTASDGQSQFCLCLPDPRIPRPRNAFILYRQHHQAAVVAQHPGLTNPDISKIIGEQWQNLAVEDKEEWKALAEEEKIRHQQQYPDYRYQPRRHGRNSNSSSAPVQSTSDSSSQSGICAKCGGKIMNVPMHPHQSTQVGNAGLPPASRAIPHRHSIAQETFHNQSRTTYQVASQQPQSARHSTNQAYPVTMSSQDPRMQQNAVLQTRSTTAVDQVADKRRRRNGEGMYVTVPAGHVPVAVGTAPMNTAHPQYSERHHSMVASDPTQVIQSHPHRQSQGPVHHQNQNHTPRTANGVPMHLIYNQPPPQATPTHSLPNQHSRSQVNRADPDLTLPPLKTPALRQASMKTADAQMSGVEAMIMSIPVLNKVKILSQIAPALAVPGPVSPAHEVRGAIIAVEGVDVASVESMTSLLADQLERDGHFAVRVFNGPLPQALQEKISTGSRGSLSDRDNDNSLTSQDILDTISQWHQISRQMVEYITARPGTADPEPQQKVEDQEDTIVVNVRQTELEEMVDENDRGSSSPRTVKETNGCSPHKVYSRIPMSAQHHLQQPCDVPPPPSQPPTPPPAPPPSEAPVPSMLQNQQREARPASKTASPTQVPLQIKKRIVSPNAVPIAIVPKYQLTIADLASVNMMITDAYSPLAHWQWLATLWRGCVGPDVTIVVQGLDDQEGEDVFSIQKGISEINQNTTTRTGEQNGVRSSLASQNMSASMAGQVAESGMRTAMMQNQDMSHQSPYPQHQTHLQSQAQQHVTTNPPAGVEVRLLDHRAVIVRTNIVQRPSVSSDKPSRNQPPSSKENSTSHIDDANWEKAKRRVAFEVEEYLRR